ncbi:MAG: hypothetical protein HZC47_03040 [Methanobacterium sp.]|uniref:hypothetical protein n=1 Tax=Methanobacterium sp. TaxID=2164 RepID=UPI003D65D4A7|nr:hypothetical protein [Methanobacterium sp.]
MDETEEKLYGQIFPITEKLKTLEKRVAIILLINSIIFLLIFKFSGGINILALVSIILFGLAVGLLFQRYMDMRLGGTLTYAIMLYYSLGNLWILPHFFAISLIGVPIGIFFMRKGYLGHLLFYLLAAIILPLSIISYFILRLYIPPFSVVPIIQSAAGIIYLVLPLIFLYNLLRIEKRKIPLNIIYMAGLLLAGWALWVFILNYLV